MKKLSLQNLNFDNSVLSVEEKRKVMGGEDSFEGGKRVCFYCNGYSQPPICIVIWPGDGDLC